MAKAIGGDPLKKQKDSLNFKNTVIDRFKQDKHGLTTAGKRLAKSLLRLAPPFFVQDVQRLAETYKDSKGLQRLAEVYKDSKYKRSYDKAKKRKAHELETTRARGATIAAGELIQQTGLRKTLTHKPKPRKPVTLLPTYVPTRGVQLTPTPAPKATKMSTPITNRLTPQSPANGKHPRKVKTREKVTRRGRTKTTKTKY